MTAVYNNGNSAAKLGGVPTDGGTYNVFYDSVGNLSFSEFGVSVFTPGDYVVIGSTDTLAQYLGTFTPNGSNESYPVLDVTGNLLVVGLFTTFTSGIFHAATLACFVRGTAITTPDGSCAVEALKIGDLVTTADGSQRPIRWIGHRSLAAPFLANNRKAAPIRFRAGSLGDGLPVRDLFVSPEHAMFLDGVLVPARCLVNGDGITQDHSLDQIDYFHIELDTHDILLAEGAPSESYLAEDGRGQFANAADYDARYPLEQRLQIRCAPCCSQGLRLQAIQGRLSEVKAA